MLGDDYIQKKAYNNPIILTLWMKITVELPIVIFLQAR